MIMLSLLLVLNIQWSYFILKVAYVALYTPKGIEDARSDSDSEDDGNDKIQCSSFTDSNGDSHNEEKKNILCHTKTQELKAVLVFVISK